MIVTRRAYNKETIAKASGDPGSNRRMIMRSFETRLTVG